jgi:hypothetical protein
VQVPAGYRFHLLQRLCLAFAFGSLEERRQLVRIRILALSVLGTHGLHAVVRCVLSEGM